MLDPPQQGKVQTGECCLLVSASEPSGGDDSAAVLQEGMNSSCSQGLVLLLPFSTHAIRKSYYLTTVLGPGFFYILK